MREVDGERKRSRVEGNPGTTRLRGQREGWRWKDEIMGVEGRRGDGVGGGGFWG